MPDKALSDLALVSSSTAFVIGNGPSLTNIDLHSLSRHTTIGMNAAYRHWREIDWYPTHYACLDNVVGVSHAAAIAAMIKEEIVSSFLLRTETIAALGPVRSSRRVINFDALLADHPILRPPTVTTGSHAALWAATLGYRQLVLLGIDGRYIEVVKGAKQRDGIQVEIVEPKDNPNYFFDGYQRPGDRYNLPNPRPDLHVEAWRMAAVMFREAGIAVYNANSNSAVRTFPFIDLSAFLVGRAAPSPADEATSPSLEQLIASRTGLGAADENDDVKRAKINEFAKRYKTVFAVLLFALIGAGTSVAVSPGASAALLIAFFCVGSVMLSLFALQLYTRFATMWHMNEVVQKIDAFSGRLSEFERAFRTERLRSSDEEHLL